MLCKFAKAQGDSLARCQFCGHRLPNGLPLTPRRRCRITPEQLLDREVAAAIAAGQASVSAEQIVARRAKCQVCESSLPDRPRCREIIATCPAAAYQQWFARLCGIGPGQKTPCEQWELLA